ncbi:methyl-accepting chemotaxis protein, partial [Clostridium sp. MT-113]
MKNYKNKTNNLKFKILFVPIIIIFITILVISSVSIGIARSKVMSQMKNDSIMLSSQMSSRVANDLDSEKTLNESIETRIITLSNFIKDNNDKVNDDYLTVLAREFQVDEINVSDPSGKVIYSNLPASLGHVYGKKESAYNVLNGGKNVLMEAIRKSNERNSYYKYGAVKNSDGGIIQIGVL